MVRYYVLAPDSLRIISEHDGWPEAKRTAALYAGTVLSTLDGRKPFGGMSGAMEQTMRRYLPVAASVQADERSSDDARLLAETFLEVYHSHTQPARMTMPAIEERAG